MVGFDNGAEKQHLLDGCEVSAIHTNLSAASADITTAKQLAANLDLAFMGDTKGGAFDLRKRKQWKCFARTKSARAPKFRCHCALG